MTKPLDGVQHLRSLFQQQPCWMIQPLCQQLQYSAPSVRRFLSQLDYYSSFTHNGAWYTLRSIPEFNRQGLWFYHDIGFSRVGSLTSTIIRLICASHAGMSATQVGEHLRCRCHSVLVNLYRQDRLQRHKLGRTYIYFAADRPTADKQRRAATLEHTAAMSLPAEIAVIILAEYIKSPMSDYRQLAAVIAQKGVRVSPLQIEKLFAEHGLKKTI